MAITCLLIDCRTGGGVAVGRHDGADCPVDGLSLRAPLHAKGGLPTPTDHPLIRAAVDAIRWRFRCRMCCRLCMARLSPPQAPPNPPKAPKPQRPK
jgi:hypothetical protein